MSWFGMLVTNEVDVMHFTHRLGWPRDIIRIIYTGQSLYEAGAFLNDCIDIACILVLFLILNL